MQICRALLFSACLNGFLAVAAGAFGAHALKERLSADMLGVFQTGAHYHLAHALAIAFAALLAGVAGFEKSARTTGWLFTAGIVLFSGSLYALALSGIKILGAITPLGGVCFLSGWLWLAISAACKPVNIELAN
jgi:uncharacterized membrane protein YgdD (TMEM256/DUF423 family)